MIKLFQPYVSWRAKWEVLKVLSGTQLAEGPKVKQFEYEFEEEFNLKNCLAVNSGTSALELAYDLAGIRPGDEVITPVLTCTATNLPLVRRGAKIVFADIKSDLNIDVDDVKKRITEKTVALVFVHFGGNNRGLAELQALGRARKIPVIEDAAQAVGNSGFGNSEYCAVSLQAIKTLTAGDGGFLICSKREDFEMARKLRWFGYDREKKQREGDTDLVEAGYKYHMNDISAAIGLGNLRSLDKVLKHREKLKAIYENSGLPIKAHSWLAILTLPGALELGKYLKEQGIETGQHHYRNDKYTVFGGGRGANLAGYLPMMDKLEKQYLLLPYHYGVSERQARRIVQQIRIYLNPWKIE